MCLFGSKSIVGGNIFEVQENVPLIFLQHDQQDKSGKKTRIVRLIVCFLKVFSKDLWEIFARKCR